MGFGGGIIINDRLLLGAYSMNLASGHSALISDEPGARYYQVNMNNAGAWIVYTPNPSRLVHMRYSLMLGAGKLEYRDDANPTTSFDSSPFYLLTPMAGVELNVLRFMKIDANLGYQLTSNFANGPSDNSELMAVVFQVGVRVGLFRQ